MSKAMNLVPRYTINRYTQFIITLNFKIMIAIKSILLYFFLLISPIVNGQNWTYSSGNNAFDGAYRTSSVKGSGGSSPYNTPRLFINYFQEQNLLNIYITNAGYAGCDNLIIFGLFQNEVN
jgi:hypothetical protein